VNGLDVVIVAAAALAAVGGWRLGFLTRSIGWLGAGLGLAIAVAVLPPLLDRLDLGSGTAVVLVGLAVLVVLASIGQGIGSAIGSRLAPPVRGGAARRLDQLGGAALGVVAVAVIGWLLFPVMSQTEGWSASSVRGSALASFSLEHLPEPPARLLDLERRALDGRFPQLFTGEEPSSELPPVPTDSPIDDARLAQLARSAVQVKGRACDVVQSGSGVVVASGLVATNAHVVAGTEDLELVTADGARAEGRVVAFDPAVDLALLATDLDRPALPLGPGSPGDRGLVLGFPGGGPFSPSPFEVAETIRAIGLDIYDRREVRRDLLVLSSELEPGDSGSAVVRPDGTVVALAVAIAPDRDGVAYALDHEQVQALLTRVSGDVVSTGECLT
jgi:uncharacterized membrane protein required for colicin V production